MLMLSFKHVTPHKNHALISAVATKLLRHIYTNSPIYAYAGGRRSHYEVLGVSKDCTTKDVRNAYLEKCKILHPDVAKTKKSDDSEFIAVKHAYEILVDEKKRSVYDNYTTYTARQRDPSWQHHRQAMKNYHEFYGIRETPPGYKFETRYSNSAVLWCGVLLACIGGLIQVGVVYLANPICDLEEVGNTSLLFNAQQNLMFSLDTKRIVKEFQKNSKKLLDEATYDGDIERRARLVTRYKLVMKETNALCPDTNSPLYFWTLQKVMVKHGILGEEYLNGNIMDSNFLLNTLLEQDDYQNLKINLSTKIQ